MTTPQGLHAPAPTERLHRLITLIALIAAGTMVVVWLVAGVFFDVSEAFVEVVFPTVLASTALAMHLRRRYRGDIVLIVAGVGIIAITAVVQREESLLASALGLVVILTAAVPFIPPRHAFRYVVAAAAVASGAGVIWDAGVNAAFTGPSMAILTGTLVLIMTLVHRASTASEVRYRTLFESIPVPTAIQDWRDVRARIDELAASGVTDFDDYFSRHHDEFVELITSVRVVDVNDAWVALLGAPSREAALGNWDESRANDRSRDYLVWSLTQLQVGATRQSREWESRDWQGNPLWLHLETFRLPDGLLPDADTIAVVNDVSGLKRAQMDLQDLLEAKDQLVASISHELRTPLTAILGFTEVLESEDALDEEETRQIRQLMRSEARDMADIIEDLLVAARARLGSVTIKPQTVDLLASAEQVVGSATQPVDVEAPQGSKLAARADPTRVSQILRNLVTNAIRHGDAPRRICWFDDGDTVGLEVRNGGDEIPPDLLARLFDPYVSGADSDGLAPSMGLGLWLSRSLAELMDGTLEHRRDGAETVFRLTLPAA